MMEHGTEMKAILIAEEAARNALAQALTTTAGTTQIALQGIAIQQLH